MYFKEYTSGAIGTLPRTKKL